MLAQKQIKLKKTGASNPVNKKQLLNKNLLMTPFRLLLKVCLQQLEKTFKKYLKKKEFIVLLSMVYLESEHTQVNSQFFKDQGLDDNIEKIEKKGTVAYCEFEN